MEQKTYKLVEIGQIVSGATPRTTDSENYGGNIAWVTPADLSKNILLVGQRVLLKKGMIVVPLN